MLVIFPTIDFCNSKYVSDILGKPTWKLIDGRFLIPLSDERNDEKVSPQHDFEAWKTPIIGSRFEEKLRWICHQWVSRFKAEFHNVFPLWFLFLFGIELPCPNPSTRSWCSNFPSTTLSCVKNLEAEIAEIDAEYDKCQEAWATGEIENFTGDKLLGW